MNWTALAIVLLAAVVLIAAITINVTLRLILGVLEIALGISPNPDREVASTPE